MPVTPPGAHENSAQPSAYKNIPPETAPSEPHENSGGGTRQEPKVRESKQRDNTGRLKATDTVEIRKQQIRIVEELDDDDPYRKSPQTLKPTKGTINLTA
ncbi:MAG: hypothetical protein GF350_03315 [Chitinivibrionales bacterium]|nr:hypothetical protein [Chitinivibrionales bacterium]